MTAVDERLAWLTATLDTIEATAEAAIPCRQIDWPEPPTGEWIHDDDATGIVEDASGQIVVYDESAPTASQAAHIALHDPRSTLAWVEADQKMLAEVMAWRHDYNDADTYYSCSQAANTWQDDRSPGSGCDDEERKGKPCDCGLDRRRAVLVDALLAAHRYMLGFREEWLS